MSGAVNRFILYTDIAGSSRLADAYARDYAALLDCHNALVLDTVENHGGVIYKNLGDGYIALFETARAAADCAVALQCALSDLPPLAGSASVPLASAESHQSLDFSHPGEERLLVRLALHGGELRQSDGEYFGPALNRASRICQVCNPGQLLCSAVVVATLSGKLPQDSVLADLGEHHLRDLAEPEHLYQLDHPGFALHDFPPLATLNNRPNNLVLQPNHFIGREKELTELAAMLQGDARLLTIIAPGGYGKSRLASQLCANLLHLFERGVFMAYLAPLRDSSLVPSGIASALGFQFSGSRDLLEQLCDYLREKDLLLCLDNFEHVMDSASLVKAVIETAPKVKLIITSREPLRIRGEQVIALEPLTIGAAATEYSEAERLFADRASLVKRSFALQPDNHLQVRDICAKLSGIPLAIELAAAWMDSFTLAELRDELGQQLELESRESDADARHRSLKASLDWSWNLLGPEQQAMLMQLSTFRGGFFADAASAVLNMKGMALRAALAKLVDKSWLYTREVQEQTRFYLRDMLAHDYAFDKLRDSDSYESAIWAHARYFSSLMARQGPRLDGDGTPTGQMEAQRVIRSDFENIDEAFDTFQNRLHSEEARAALLPIARWLYVYMRLVSSFSLIQPRYETLSRPANQGPGADELRLQGLLAFGVVEVQVGNSNNARPHILTARDIAESIGDRQGLADALEALCYVESVQGNVPLAREMGTAVLAMAPELQDLNVIARAHLHLEMLFWEHAHDDAECIAHVKAAQAIQRDIGDRNGLAHTLNRLSIVEHHLGESIDGQAMNAEAMAIFRELGNRNGEARCLAELSMFRKSLGDIQASRECLSGALSIAREVGNRNLTAHVLINLTVLDIEEEDIPTARNHAAEALALSRATGEHRNLRRALHCMGIVCFAEANHLEALGCYSEAQALNIEIGSSRALEVAVAIAELLATLGRLEPAALCLYALTKAPELGVDKVGTIEQGQVNRALALIEDPETGLPLARRELLQAQAAGMNEAELAQFTLDELQVLKPQLKAQQ